MYMKFLNKILSYRELIVLLTATVYGLIEGISIKLIILMDILLGAFLLLIRLLNSRVLRTISTNNDTNREDQKNDYKGVYKDSEIIKEQSVKTEQEKSINKFEAEINGLRNLIKNARRYCEICGYDLEAANKFIDEKCKAYVDIFIPVVAISPDIFNILIEERSSLKAYLMENINRYFINRPSESEVEKEFIKIMDKTKTSVDNNDGFMDSYTCVWTMVNKYGFSQEVLHAANKLDPQLFTMVLRLYDMRLREAQSLSEEENMVLARGTDKMDFKRERISDMERVKYIVERLGIKKKDFRFHEWVIDKQKEQFLVKLQGDGYSDKKNIGVFAFGCGDGLIRIEATYDVAGRALDGCGVYWQIKKLQIPMEMKEKKNTIISNIRKAFMAYGIGFDAMVQEFKLELDCEPEFTEVLPCEEDAKESQLEKPEEEQKEELDRNMVREKNSENINCQKFYDETARLFKLSEKERTLEKIKELGFEDSIFYITLHNNRIIFYRHPSEDTVNPYELFPHKSGEEIEIWINRANKLLKSTFDASDAYLCWIRNKALYEKYQKAREALMSSNPGFSSEVYDKAIDVGLVNVR